MKAPLFISFILTALFIISDCSSSNDESSENILRDQIGTLAWRGSPAVDGTGMLFIVGDTEYGAPGTPEDYSEYFDNDDYEVIITADFVLTGEETVRGWGATFPEIEFLEIEKY